MGGALKEATWPPLGLSELNPFEQDVTCTSMFAMKSYTGGRLLVIGKQVNMS